MTTTGHTDAVVEAVLSGAADDAVPAELERVAALVRAAQTEPSASESEMPPWLLDTLASGIDDGPTAAANRRVVPIGRRIAVVTTSLVLATTGMAAATGHLPDPAQAAIARAARPVGVDLPEPPAGERPRPTPTPAPTSSTSSSDRPSSTATTVAPPSVSTPATAPTKDCAPPADPPECAQSRATHPSPPPTTQGPRRDGDPPPAATRPADPGPPSSIVPPSTRPTRPTAGSGRRGEVADLPQHSR